MSTAPCSHCPVYPFSLAELTPAGPRGAQGHCSTRAAGVSLPGPDLCPCPVLRWGKVQAVLEPGPHRDFLPTTWGRAGLGIPLALLVPLPPSTPRARLSPQPCQGGNGAAAVWGWRRYVVSLVLLNQSLPGGILLLRNLDLASVRAYSQGLMCRFLRWREQELGVPLTWCGAELCGPHLACGSSNSIAL